MQKFVLEISLKNFLQILALLLGLVLLYQIRDLLILLFFSLILMSAFNPIVDRLERLGLPRFLAILSLYFVLVAFLTLFLGSLIPSLTSQTEDFIRNLPLFTERALNAFGFGTQFSRAEIRSLLQDLAGSFSSQIVTTPISLLRIGAGIFGGFLTLISLFVFTFYLLLEHKKIKRNLVRITTKDKRQEALDLIERVEKKLGAWLRGELILMALVGLMVFFGLWTLQVRFVLPLAILAGLLEIVPIIGPLTSTVPALIVAAAFSPLKAVSVALLFLFVQQFENNFLVPKVMKEATGLDPILVILSLMIGGKLLGIWGALLSVPILAIVLILLNDFFKERI